MLVLASQTIVEAREGPVSCTLVSLLTEYGYESDSLEGIAHITRVLDHFKINVDPAIGTYSTSHPRTLKPERAASKIREIIKRLLDEGGENYSVELKSSIAIDRNKQKHCPDLTIQDYVNEGLKAKVAQEIAAFLNRDGGTILFGISNDLELIGCGDDFSAFSKSGSPQDKADLIIKQIVDKHFYDPKKALSNIQIDCEEYEGSHIIMVSITPMSTLAFLKVSEVVKYSLYMRIGTSADPIPYHEIESHYVLTKNTVK